MVFKECFFLNELTIKGDEFESKKSLNFGFRIYNIKERLCLDYYYWFIRIRECDVSFQLGRSGQIIFMERN